MNVREQGFLLLTGYLGDPDRRPLTIAQFRRLAQMVSAMPRPEQQRDLTESDLLRIGCDRTLARKTLQLLEQTDLLQYYLHDGALAACTPITRIGDAYPHRLRKALGLDAPGTLWCKGDKTILHTKTISVVGSRDLRPENIAFAEELGKQAALQGYTLVSGNARGADRTAQEACLKYGGKVIAVVADALKDCPARENVLYLSEEGFDLPFSAQRALQRNRVIHSFSDMTFVVQCALGKGGTWRGTNDNLRQNWSRVICFADGTDAALELEQLGSMPVGIPELADFSELLPRELNFLE